MFSCATSTTEHAFCILAIDSDKKGRELEAGNVVLKGNRMTVQTVQVFMITGFHPKEKLGVRQG